MFELCVIQQRYCNKGRRLGTLTELPLGNEGCSPNSHVSWGHNEYEISQHGGKTPFSRDLKGHQKEANHFGRANPVCLGLKIGLPPPPQ